MKQITFWFLTDSGVRTRIKLILTDKTDMKHQDLTMNGFSFESKKKLTVGYNGYEVGLLLNFGRKPEFKRKYFTNERKKHVFIR